MLQITIASNAKKEMPIAPTASLVDVYDSRPRDSCLAPNICSPVKCKIERNLPFKESTFYKRAQLSSFGQLLSPSRCRLGAIYPSLEPNQPPPREQQSSPFLTCLIAAFLLHHPPPPSLPQQTIQPTPNNNNETHSNLLRRVIYFNSPACPS
jgi:hypothetical protein